MVFKESMIIVKLMGGLGNQMFQYAAGRSLSEKHHTALKLDLNFLLDRTPRKDFVFRDYDLDLFNIHESFASPDETNSFNKYHRIDEELNRVKRKLYSSLSDSVLRSPYFSKVAHVLARTRNTIDSYLPVYMCEDPHRFDPRFFRLHSRAYLDGYWQSEKYFLDIKSIIRKEFTFRDNLDERGREMSDRISAVNAVCLNVRRGDFVTIPVASQHHGVCEADYFSRAATIISEKVSNPHLFIFSDDIEWCRAYLRFEHSCTIVDHEYAGKKFGQYLQLMSMCKHFIIPNSSFGWWAAWLCPNPDKIVISPQRWYQSRHMDTQYLIPDSWIRI